MDTTLSPLEVLLKGAGLDLESPEVQAAITLQDKKVEDITKAKLSAEFSEDTFTHEQVQELIKSQGEQLLIKARREVKAELQAEQLEKDTTELIKGMNFVDPNNVTSLVKAMTSVNKELGGVILKCFVDMEDIIKAKDEEVEEIRRAFAPQQSLEGTPTTTKNHFASSQSEQRTQELDEIVKAKLANKATKK